MTKSSQRIVTLLAASLMAAGLVLGGPATPADAEDGVSKKLKRQIGVMERVLDEVMLESPNLLVHSREITRGIYLAEFGVLFVLEASLVHEGWEGKWPGDVRIERKDGNIIIIRSDEDEDDEDEDADEDDEKEDMTWEESQKESQQEMYAAGKAELIEALVDYGETLTGLDTGQWVGVAAFMRDSSYFVSSKSKVSRLIIKAKMKDLRDHASGQLSREAMEQKVVVEEY